MESIKEHFTRIYAGFLWGPDGSGPGSTITNTVKYREYIQNFLKEKDIKTIIDYGCGDWQSTRLLNFDGIEYLGIDCVDSIIESNITHYKKDNINFLILNELEEFFSYKADLLIMKDVIQHWTVEEINLFLPKIKWNYKYILITNSSGQSIDNEDEPFRNRPLSARFEPLKKFNPEIVLEYVVDTPKEISLLKDF